MKNPEPYYFLDSGGGEKLEQFGSYRLIRPAAVAVWEKQLNNWESADAAFSRKGAVGWTVQTSLPKSWIISINSLQFLIAPTDFGHLGLFPEQETQWKWIEKTVEACPTKPSILNLFAYSGGATLAAAKAGASVTHVDASAGMVSWARENAKLNQLENAPIRWIVEDVKKYLTRCERRGERFDGIILDPPSFGRGPKKELFKIEEDLPPLLLQCVKLLSDKPLFILFSCHTPGFTPIVLKQLLEEALSREGEIEAGEMLLEGRKGGFCLPSGCYARWRA